MRQTLHPQIGNTEISVSIVENHAPKGVNEYVCIANNNFLSQPVRDSCFAHKLRQFTTELHRQFLRVQN